MRIHHPPSGKVLPPSSAGYTLLELIIIVAIIGMIGAIAAPSWMTFVNRERLDIAQNQVYRGMQEAKSNAELQKVTWQFSIREAIVNDKAVVQWAIHPESTNPAIATWQRLESGIHLYPEETTLYKDKKNGIQRVQFNYIGNTNGQLGQLTLTTDNNSNFKRCVYVSTLIGTLRMGREHSKANDSKKHCY